MAVDLMIVGSQKCGTTSLLSYLGQHPAITPQIRGEMTWFVDSGLRARPFPADFYFGRSDPGGRLRLGKLAGLMYNADGVARLREHNPAVRAIAILREPVSRAYSSYWHARRRGHEPMERFEDAIRAGTDRFAGAPNAERWSYLEWGKYAHYLGEVEEMLGREAVHVAILEEFLSHPTKSMESLRAPLGLDLTALGDEVPSENSAGVARSQGLARLWTQPLVKQATRRVLPQNARDAVRRQYRRANQAEFRAPPMNPETKRELRQFFEEPNRQLEALLGRTIEAWRYPVSRDVDLEED